LVSLRACLLQPPEMTLRGAATIFCYKTANFKGRKEGRKVCRNFSLRRPLRLVSGRLDSNQRPPEPHSESSQAENRKSKPNHGLQFSHFQHFTQRNRQNP